jgi:hypothetical protein
MAQQIKKKFLSPELIGQVDTLEQSVTALGASKADKSYVDQKDGELASSVTALEGVVQGNFDLQQSDIDGLRSDVDANSSAISSEITAREAGDVEAKAYADQVSAAAQQSANDYTLQIKGELETAFDQGLNGSLLVNGSRGMEGNLIMGDTSGTMHKIVALGDGVDPKDAVNKSQLDSVESGLQSQIDNVLSNVDPAAIDSLTEIVSAFQAADNNLNGAITQLATELGSDIAAEETARIAADAVLQGKIDEEQSLRNTGDVQTLDAAKAYTDTQIAAIPEVDLSGFYTKTEVDNKDSAIIDRLEPIENRELFKKYSLYNDSAAVFSNGKAGVEDTSAITRDGWYFQNTNASDVIGWYFYDKNVSMSPSITKAQFSAFAVMTFDAVGANGAKPIFGVYSYPTGTNDAFPNYFHSRWSYQMSQATLNSMVAGKKVLLYIGQNPEIHPELEHHELVLVAGASYGEKLESEVIGFCSFNSEATTVNKAKWLVESLGVETQQYKQEATLKIRHAQKAVIEASLSSETSARQLADSQLSTRVTAIEAKGFSKGSVTVGAELGHIDLDKEYVTLLTVSVGRAVVHEGEDFTVSVVSGKTRLTWINSLANPNGEEKIETGDKVFFVGSF